MVCSGPIFNQSSLEPTRFTCNASDKIEASVATDDTIDGTGSTANPLTITPSVQDNNDIGLGSDGKVFSCAYNNDTVSQGNAAASVVAIDAVATYTIFTSPTLTITNPSDCRTQELMLVGDNTLQVTLLDTGVWQVRVEESIDGGAFTAIASVQYGAFAPVGIILPFPVVIPVNEVYAIAASSSIDIQRRIVVQTLVGSPVGSQVESYALGMRAVVVSK